MNTIYILVILWSGGMGGNQITYSMEFANKASCTSAADQLASKEYDISVAQKFVCIPKNINRD